jgi:hypothetical protein
MGAVLLIAYPCIGIHAFTPTAITGHRVFSGHHLLLQ